MMNVQIRSLSHHRRILASASDPPWYNPLGEELSIWGAWQAKGAASYAGSLVNLADPGTHDLTEGNGAVPWSAALGWQFVQANAQYLKTGHQDFHTSVTTYIAQITGYSGGGACIMGAAGQWNQSGAVFNLALRYNDAFAAYQCENAGYTNLPLKDTANIALAAKKVYAEGVHVGTIANNNTSIGQRETIIGATHHRDTGALQLHCTANIRAAAVYTEALGDTTIAAVAAAMAAL